MNNELEKMWKKEAMADYEVLRWHLPRRSRENHEKLQSEESVCLLVFEARTSRMQVRSLNCLSKCSRSDVSSSQVNDFSLDYVTALFQIHDICIVEY
jgi:hypothetical protein